MLHDGTITGYAVHEKGLRLTVECIYLAVLVDKTFDTFFIDLVDIEMLCLSTWPNPFDQPVKLLMDPMKIFKAELGILSADVKDNRVLVSCNQSDKSFDYSGGDLLIACEKIKIFDQNKNEISIDELDGLCRQYWENL